MLKAEMKEMLNEILVCQTLPVLPQESQLCTPLPNSMINSITLVA